MQKLLSAYSVQDILIFICILAVAIKGATSFIQWAIQKLRKVFKKQSAIQTRKQQVDERITKDEQIVKTLSQGQKQLTEAVSAINKKVDMLIQSDMEDIKSFLTKEHHYFCYQKGWIDDYNLECCEKRYVHYVAQGGNSFIEQFMNELRALPKQPPLKN